MIMVPADKDKCVTIASWGDKISVPALVRPLSCSLGAKSTTGGGVGGGGDEPGGGGAAGRGGGCAG